MQILKHASSDYSVTVSSLRELHPHLPFRLAFCVTRQRTSRPLERRFTVKLSEDISALPPFQTGAPKRAASYGLQLIAKREKDPHQKDVKPCGWLYSGFNLSSSGGIQKSRQVKGKKPCRNSEAILVEVFLIHPRPNE
jgi:hypothetical protein